jgi:hypothetical protein
MPKLFKRLIVALVGLTGAVVISWFMLSRPLGFQPVPEGGLLVAAGDTLVDGLAIRPFRAVYRRQSRVFGVPVRSGSATLQVQPAEGPGGPLLQANIGFGAGAGIADRIVLDHGTLAPLGRRYEIPPQRAATIVFDGARVSAEVTLGDSVVQDTTFEFEHPVFEVSLLELLLASLPLAEGFSALVSWDNMANSEESQAQLRVVGREQVIAGDGASYETWIVHVRFASGRVRAFWIAQAPPYKIRLVNYLNGRAVTNSWELVSGEW